MERLRTTATITPFNSALIKERDPDSVVPKANPKEKAVFDYVAATAMLVSAHTASTLHDWKVDSSITKPMILQQQSICHMCVMIGSLC